MQIDLLPRATLRDVLHRAGTLVGSRLDPDRPRGVVSPIEARVGMGIPYGRLDEEERAYLDDPGRGAKNDAAVLARALVARLLAPSGGARPFERPHIVSARVDNLTIERAVREVFAEPRPASARIVHIVHPHALNLAAFDRGLAALLAHADLVLPDGIGVRIAARLLGVAMRHNLNGTDLLPLLCREAALRRTPMILIGARDGVAERCAENLCRTHAGLRIPFVHQGYLDDSESARVCERLRSHGPSLVLVGMGTPVQERWVWRWLRDLEGSRVLTVGGLFDFFAGNVPRAPVAWRELGLEWLWRLQQEPRRLARRYLIGNPLFLALALAQRIFGIPAELD